MACFVSTLTYVLCRIAQHYCWQLATACNERTSAPGTSAPLPTWGRCSGKPLPSTGTAGSRGLPALGGTQSPKKI
eukprot:2523872-Amphidinium_carterae.1